MPESIRMPQLGESVTEGTISAWLKSEGDEVELDEPIAEIDTDKVSTELPSPLAGRLEKILVAEGETVDVGVEIASIETGNTEDIEAEAAEWPTAGTEAQPVAVEAGESRSVTATGTPGGNGTFTRLRSAEELRLTRSSPVVRRLAAEHDVELASVSGTGTGGRVTKKDILAHVANGESVPQQQAEEQSYFAPPEPEESPRPVRPAPSAPAMSGDETLPLTSIRKAIASRMSTSKREAPHAWTMVEVDMTNLVRHRAATKDDFKRREGVSLTYLPFIIEAVVGALKEYPVVNSVWGEDGIILRRDLNIGVAVDIEDGSDKRNGALVVPVIRDADGYNATGLARKTAELVGKARSKQLTPDDLAGGTFTVNNPGALGSIVSVPIINHPQAAILSAEAIVKRPVVMEQWDDAIVVRSIMNLEMSFDHRIFDGGIALRFLNAVKRRLEGYING